MDSALNRHDVCVLFRNELDGRETPHHPGTEFLLSEVCALRTLPWHWHGAVWNNTHGQAFPLPMRDFVAPVLAVSSNELLAG
jgi:hypothetical protein